MRRPGQITIFRAPDDDGGTGAAGADDAAAGAAGGGQSAGGDGTGDQSGTVVPYRPDGLPDDMVGANERETIDKLFGANKGFREAIGKIGELGKLPKTADDYAFEPSEKAKPFLGDLAKDPVMKIAREIALKTGIRDKQFGPFISGVIDAMVDGDMVQPAIDVEAETAKLVPADAVGLDDAGKKAAVDRRVRDNHAMIETWKSRGLPEESAQQLALTLDTAAANQAVEWFAKAMRSPQPGLGGDAGQGFTEADLRARQRDPRNKVGDNAYDQAFVDQTNAMFKALYPE